MPRTKSAAGYLVVASFAWTLFSAYADVAAGSEGITESFAVFDDGDCLLVPVTIGARNYSFVVDTGSVDTIVDRSLVDEIKKVGGRASVGQFPLRLTDATPAYDFAGAREQESLDIRGLLGLDFLQKYVLRLDFDRGRLSISDFCPPDPGAAIPIRWHRDGYPFVRAAIEGWQPEYFMVDTGCVAFGAGCLARNCATRLWKAGLLERPASSLVGSLEENEIVSVSGFAKGMTLGEFHHSSLELGEHPDVNILGLGYWRRYCVTLDFRARRMYLKPSKHYNAVDRRDNSGLGISRVDGRTIVEALDEGTPAAEAGIKPGDELLSVGAVACAGLRPFEVQKALANAQDAVEIVLKRSGETVCARMLLGTAEAAIASEAEPVTLQSFPVFGDGDILLLPVTIGAKEFLFAVDTGSCITVCDDSIVDDIKAAAEKPRIGVLPLPLRDPPLSHDLGLIRKVSGHEIRGFVGLDFLHKYIVRLDCDAGKLSFLTRADADGAKLPLLPRRDGCLTVLADFFGHGTERFRIGTALASSQSGCVMPGLLRGLIEEGNGVESSGGLFATSRGQEKHDGLTISGLEMAGYAHARLEFGGHPDGNVLSMSYLSRYLITFDFPRSVMYVAPSKKFSRVDGRDDNGLHFLRDAGRTLVDSVDDDSPAERAGIKPGDELLRIGGFDAGEERMYVLRDALAHSPGGIAITVNRDGKQHTVRLQPARPAREAAKNQSRGRPQ